MGLGILATACTIGVHTTRGNSDDKRSSEVIGDVC